MPAALEWAVNLAQSGRPGPVLLDIPMDIQRSELNPALYTPHPKIANPIIDENKLDQIITALAKAQRPVVLAGGGVRTAPSLPGIV